jgi:iron(III) transport system permease protein
MALSAWALRGRDYASVQKGGSSLQRRSLTPLQAVRAWGVDRRCCCWSRSRRTWAVLLLSFARVWSFSPLPDAYTLAHYATVFADAGGMIRNTLVYCGWPPRSTW